MRSTDEVACLYTKKKDLKKLFSQIAKIIKTNIPEIDYSKLIKEISTIKVQYKLKESNKTQETSGLKNVKNNPN